MVEHYRLVIFLDKTKRGGDSDAYHRSRHEIDTVIGHSLGGAVARSLAIKKEGKHLYGIVQSKIFGVPIVSGNLGNRFGKPGKSVVKNSISDLGVIGGVSTGAVLDTTTGLFDGGFLIGLGANIG